MKGVIVARRFLTKVRDELRGLHMNGLAEPARLKIDELDELLAIAADSGRHLNGWRVRIYTSEYTGTSPQREAHQGVPGGSSRRGAACPELHPQGYGAVEHLGKTPRDDPPTVRGLGSGCAWARPPRLAQRRGYLPEMVNPNFLMSRMTFHPC